MKKFLISNWFITLFSTMLGVFAGLYLSNYFEAKKFKAAQREALEMIKKEIRNNQEILIEYDSISRLKIEQVAYFFSKTKGDLSSSDMLIHNDSLASFKQKTKELIDNMETEKAENSNDSLKISGDANINIQSRLIVGELSNIAWNSYKQTNYTDITNFECITDIELIYQLQDDFNTINETLKDQFYNGYWINGKEQRDEFINQWVKVIQRGSLLLQTYENTDDVLFKNCN
ncbi:hypothetical protein [Winogradskyella sp.]|uniref:hypothetical protein n=1 Tax=Winogradskyella sp. TaxID=1883156 RepID=UPI00260B9B7B|nr:hypothetical protein [Winogradskyella sp.]